MSGMIRRSVVRRLLPVALLVLTSAWASAESSVWRVQKDDSVMYLGGTSHMLRETDFPLPPEFDYAYKTSGVVVFETDIGKLQGPAIRQKMLAMTTYSDGTKVADHLKDSTYAELSAYCVSNRVPLALLEHFKPGMLMVTIGLMELMKLGVTQQGVDMVYHQRAVADRKTIKELETIDEQISYIASMVDGCEDEFVTYSLRDMRNIKSQFDDLVSAWRKGDSERLGDMLMAELKTTVPGLYEKLVLARNKNWLPMMEGFAGTPEVEFVLVGVAHLVGPDSVIEALSKKGYKVEKLKIPAGQ